ncbi:hypothetical protein ACFFQF_16510 [Haladaptatus pallidirubidus]|uniref:ABC-2 type transport system permease protein n=1 Tax=Haladaptatus pallidirubidus TaxID=1008152 RepID=A0AAV3URE5_9EURY|nr:hypothetical protein [Haladaptatus pallidirubidus]
MSQINFREIARLKISRLGGYTIQILLMGMVFGWIAATPMPTLIRMLEQQGYSAMMAELGAFLFYLSLYPIFAIAATSVFSDRKNGQSLWGAFTGSEDGFVA